MGQLRQAHQSIVDAGGRLLAVSVDRPEDSARTVQKLNLPFPILADVERKVIKDYSLVHPAGGPDGSDIAIPAHFLIASDGKIAWRYVAKRIQDRPNPETDLSALIELNAK